MNSQDHFKDDFEGEFKPIKYLPKRKIDKEESSINSVNPNANIKRIKRRHW